MSILDRIEQRLAHLKKSAYQASKEAGNPDIIRKLRKGYTTNLRMDTLKRLAESLEVSEDWLLHGSPPPKKNIINQDNAENFKKVPVIGVARGSILGHMVLDNTPIDYVAMPPAASHMRDIYAIYVTGESMSPVHNHGDIRFISPHKPFKKGDDIIIQTQNNQNDLIEAMIARYDGEEPDFIKIIKINKNNHLKINRKTIKAMHKVLTLNELFGV